MGETMFVVDIEAFKFGEIDSFDLIHGDRNKRECKLWGKVMSSV